MRWVFYCSLSDLTGDELLLWPRNVVFCEEFFVWPTGSEFEIVARDRVDVDRGAPAVDDSLFFVKNMRIFRDECGAVTVFPKKEF